MLLSSVILTLFAMAAPQDSKPASAPAPSNELMAALAAAVDQETPDARARAAAALASRPESLEECLAAARAFGNFTKIERGLHRVTVPLRVNGAMSKYELLSWSPASYDGTKPVPLILALHGSGGQADEMVEMWRPVAERAGLIVIANTEPLAKAGFSFKPEERDAVLGMLRYARRNYNIDENRIFCTGVSRGGHLTWDTALRYPDSFAGIAPMIGGPWSDPSRGAANMRYLPQIVHLTIRDLQGAQDDPGLVGILRITFQRLTEMKAPDAGYIEFPDLGHSFKMDAVKWDEFYLTKTRNPVPQHVTVCSVKSHDAGRAFWAEITGVAAGMQEIVKPKMTPAEFDSFKVLSVPDKSRKLSELAEKQTARLDVTMNSPGVFSAKGTGVTKIRILLSESMFDPKKPVTVQFNGKNKTGAIKPDKKVLFADFVERFDRTFLPVGEVRVE